MTRRPHISPSAAWLCPPVVPFVCAQPAWAGYNEGNWSPDVAGPALMIAAVALLVAPIGYVLGRFGFVLVIRALTVLLALAALGSLGAMLYLFGDFAALIPMMALCFFVPATLFFMLSARFGARSAAQGDAQ